MKKMNEKENDKEILLQKRGAVIIKAYIKGKNLAIIYETQQGKQFSGISLLINATLLKNLTMLTETLHGVWDEGK